MSPESIITGFCLGIIITSLTIFFTSVRISRINIIRAIRDLPEPTYRTVRTRTLILGGIFAAVNIGGFVASLGNEDAWATTLLCPALAAFGLLPIITSWIKRRLAVFVVSGFSLAWGIFGNTLLGNQIFETGEIFAFVLQGVLLTFSAVVMLSQTADNFEIMIRKVAARNLPVRLGLAYPVARRFRTGLTLGMYALVIFTMTFISVLSSVFGGQVDDTVRRASGGFDIVLTASASSPPQPDEIARVEGVQDVVALYTGIALFNPPEVEEPEPWPATGIEEDFVQLGPPVLEERDEGEFDSDKEVWEALLADPTLVVLPDFFLEEGGGPPGQTIGPGESMEVIDPVTGKSSERTVAGVLSSDVAFSGVYMSKESVRSILGPRATPSRFFVDAEEGVSASSVAADLQGTLFQNGVEADTFGAIVEEFQSLSLQFFRLMQGYLALGLLVGIAGLGVVMVRAVRERRREIGVLRALGFQAHMVRRAFLFESGFTSIQGIVIGSVLALITAAQLVATGEFGESAAFTIPWTQLLLTGGLAFLASLLATAWPAQQASQVPPAVALRVAE
ncbi:MAG TPA: FtsX-like permease family protein, partial [Actinomycetota bacterium]|nr:FtsX-like permease family protein [Actinomycetota bacterium]